MSADGGEGRTRGEDLVSGWRRWLGYALPTLAGALLRLDRVGAQVLVGDELHGLHAAALFDLPKALRTFLPSDGCIPLTALFRALMDLGFVLDERVLRMPSLVAGVAMPFVLPRLLERRIGSRAAFAFAWLLALAPGLVLYSRIVRPYSIVALLGGVAVISFLRFWSGDGRRWAVAYAVTAPLAIWFHLGALPFVGLPIALAWSTRPWSRNRPSWRELVALTAATGLGAAVLLGPPLAQGVPWLEATNLERTNPFPVRSAQAVATAQLLLGTRGKVAAACFGMTAVLGLGMVARRDRELAVGSATLFVALVVGFWWLRPVGLANPVVFHRYLLVATAVPLLWIAVALAWTSRYLASRRWTRSTAGTVWLLIPLYLTAGPLLDDARRWSSYRHQEYRLGYVLPAIELAPEVEPPAFYRWLGGGGRSEPLVEYLGTPTWIDPQILAV